MISHYKQDLLDHVCICADGATTMLLKKSIIPDIIVSDLDGNIHDQIYANQKGSIYFILFALLIVPPISLAFSIYSFSWSL